MDRPNGQSVCFIAALPINTNSCWPLIWINIPISFSVLHTYSSRIFSMILSLSFLTLVNRLLFCTLMLISNRFCFSFVWSSVLRLAYVYTLSTNFKKTMQYLTCVPFVRYFAEWVPCNSTRIAVTLTTRVCVCYAQCWKSSLVNALDCLERESFLQDVIWKKNTLGLVSFVCFISFAHLLSRLVTFIVNVHIHQCTYIKKNIYAYLKKNHSLPGLSGKGRRHIRVIKRTCL